MARAISHRVRTDKRQALHLGDWVYVWRQDKNHIKGKYVGPARVVGGHSRLVLIELSGKVYRTSAQFIIHVSNVKSDIGAAEGDTLGQPSSGDVGFPITENMMLSPDVAMPPALNAEDADLAWPDIGQAANEINESYSLQLPQEPDLEKTADAPASLSSLTTPRQNSGPSTQDLEGENTIVLPKEPEFGVGNSIEGLSAEDETNINNNENRVLLAHESCENNDEDFRKPKSSPAVGVTSEWAKFAEKGKTVPNRYCSEGAWNEAKMKEINALYKYDSVEEIPLTSAPEGARILDSLWVNTIKFDPIDNNSDPTEFHLDEYYRAKSRITARGDQEKDLDLLLASPTADRSILRLVLGLVPILKWRVASLDITNAFLQGNELPPSRQIYIRPPPEVLQGKPGIVWKAKKCIYGLADAPLSWHKSLTEALVKIGGKVSKYDPSVIIFGKGQNFEEKEIKGKPLPSEVEAAHDAFEGLPEGNYSIERTESSGVAVVFVDDILIAGTNEFRRQATAHICDRFDVGKIEEDEFKHLGVNVKHDIKDNIIEIAMPGYSDKIKKIPMSSLRESVNNDTLSPFELRQFRAALGQLAWLAGNVRPDLAAECSMLLSKELEAEHNCLKEDISAEDAHKALKPDWPKTKESKVMISEKRAEGTSWFLDQARRHYNETSKEMVYKIKRKNLKTPRILY